MSNLRNKIRIIEAANESAISELEKLAQELDNISIKTDTIPNQLENYLSSLNIENEHYEDIYGPFSEIGKLLNQLSDVSEMFNKKVEEIKKGLENLNQ